MNRRDVESPAIPAGPRVNECADVGVARRDHAIEGRNDFFVSLHFFQTLDVCRRGIRDGLFRVHIGHHIICILPRHRAPSSED